MSTIDRAEQNFARKQHNKELKAEFETNQKARKKRADDLQAKTYVEAVKESTQITPLPKGEGAKKATEKVA